MVSAHRISLEGRSDGQDSQILDAIARTADKGGSKMTRQRALRLAREWSQGHVCSLRDGEAAEYHSMFAAMLEESTLNEPLTQADLDVMDYDKVWIDYGDDGEWALVVSDRIYALAVLEGAGFGDILRDEVDGETMDRPSGNYTVYRRPPEREEDT